MAANNLSWSVKAGAFFPTISLENDDLGWASPYTLTPSAINSWIGDELRTIGSEAAMKWKTGPGPSPPRAPTPGCNDGAGLWRPPRGWPREPPPPALFERAPLPVATQKL